MYAIRSYYASPMKQAIRVASILWICCSFWVFPAFSQDTPATPIKVLVAYHSLTGNTERMAEAVAEGAKGLPGTDVVMKRVEEVTADDLFSSDALVVGSPVYWSVITSYSIHYTKLYDVCRIRA